MESFDRSNGSLRWDPFPHCRIADPNFTKAHSIPVPRLALVANAQDPDKIVCRVIHVQPQIAGIPARHHQLAQFPFDAAADQGMAGQDAGRIEHVRDRLGGGFGRLLQQEIRQAFQIGKRLSREDYLRHLTGLGRLTFSPRAFARM